MRRFFRAQRDEDYSQIQYLTAKCTRLAHDKAVLDRDVLVSRERERKLQNDLEVVAARLLHQEQMNVELRMKHNQLLSRSLQQQDVVELLQQRLVLLLEESRRDTELLRQVGSELLCLQSSEAKLEALVEELHAEAQRRAAAAESLRVELHAQAQGLHTELRSKTVELEKLRDLNERLTEELKGLHAAHQKEVRELQQEKQRSLRNLPETVEQFEWLCQQQRYWMCCVKRFKDCLMEERETLLQQLCKLQKRAEKLKMSPTRSLTCDRSSARAAAPPPPVPVFNLLVSSSGESARQADHIASRMESAALYEQLCSQSPINGYQKPP